MKNKEEMLKTIGAASFGVGLFLLIGTAGSADCNVISFEQAMLQGIISAVMMLVPVLLGLLRGW